MNHNIQNRSRKIKKLIKMLKAMLKAIGLSDKTISRIESNFQSVLYERTRTQNSPFVSKDIWVPNPIRVGVDLLPADSFRVKNETLILSISLIFFLLFLIFISTVSLAILPLLIIFSAIAIKTKQGQLLGGAIKVSENQLPEVYKAAKIAASRLYMPIPDIFVTQNPVINAYAIGFLGKKSVVLHSKTVESMTHNELASILGHEFAHIKCNHTKWMVITSSTESIRIPLLSSIFGFIFLFWSRKAEYTADRGGLIASRNLSDSVSSLIKVAVGAELIKDINVENLVKQMEESDFIDKFSEIFGTHPYILNRIMLLKKYSQSKHYPRILGDTDFATVSL
jgi:Zn-dependent protease with chaperone function